MNRPLLLAALSLACAGASAQTAHPDSPSSRRLQDAAAVNVQQERRIEAGRRSGALTPHEAARLERGQARVVARQARAAADGHVGPREHAGIQRAQARQSVRIYEQKHDRQNGG